MNKQKEQQSYAQIVSYNNSIIQQFKTYKETREKAILDVVNQLSTLTDVKEREKQTMLNDFETERQNMLNERQNIINNFEKEKQNMTNNFEKEKQIILNTKTPDQELNNNIIVNKALSQFFKNK